MRYLNKFIFLISLFVLIINISISQETFYRPYITSDSSASVKYKQNGKMVLTSDDSTIIKNGIAVTYLQKSSVRDSINFGAIGVATGVAGQEAYWVDSDSLGSRADVDEVGGLGLDSTSVTADSSWLWIAGKRYGPVLHDPIIAFADSASSTDPTSLATKQWAHTVAGDYLIVGVINGNTRTIDSMKVWTGAGAKTSLANIAQLTGSPGVNLWGVKAPPTGVDTIQVWWNSACVTVCFSASYSGVNQTTSTGTGATNTGTGTTFSVDLTAAGAENLVLCVAENENGRTMSATSSSTIERLEISSSGNRIALYEMRAMGSVSPTGSFSASATDWKTAGVALKPK